MELSEFKANEGKQVNIQVGDRTFARHAIATHFVQVGESYMDLIQKYVVPFYQEGDILSSSEKIISLCQMCIRDRGKTVLVSTHIFSLVEKLCDRVGVIIDGTMALCGTLDEVCRGQSLEDRFFELYVERKGEGA